MSDSSELGRRLHEARSYLGLSQEYVSTRVGMHRSALSDVERGRRRIDADELRRLAELYGRSTDVLLGTSPSETTDDVQVLARRIGELNDEDVAEVIRFADFLRTRTSSRRSTP